jgi:hypothetical protein
MGLGSGLDVMLLLGFYRKSHSSDAARLEFKSDCLQNFSRATDCHGSWHILNRTNRKFEIILTKASSLFHFHFSSLASRTNLLPLPLNPHRLFIMRRHHMHQPDRNLRDVIRHTRLQLRQAIAPVAADCIAAGRRTVRVRVHVPVEGAGAIEEKPVEVQH